MGVGLLTKINNCDAFVLEIYLEFLGFEACTLVKALSVF